MQHLLLLLLTASFLSAAASEWPTVLEIDIGETVQATRGGQTHQFRLVSLTHESMPFWGTVGDQIRTSAYYTARAQLEIDGGAPVEIIARPYQMPTVVAGGMRVYIDFTGDWARDGVDPEAVSKDVRMSFVHAGETWGPSWLRFPIVGLRWHASTYHNTSLGVVPQMWLSYYHKGEDWGAIGNRFDVVAMMPGTIGRDWGETQLWHATDNVFLRYFHMDQTPLANGGGTIVEAGQVVSLGQKLGQTGSVGGMNNSGQHLHVDINTVSGRVGTFPYMAESYLRDNPDPGLALAGGFQFTVTGRAVALDGRRSFARPGRTIAGMRWHLTDGQVVDGPTASFTSAISGYFAQELRVYFDDGSELRDFTVVRVFDVDPAGDPLSHSHHYTGFIYMYPHRGIQPGQPVEFQHQGVTDVVLDREIDFGDGTVPVILNPAEATTTVFHAFAQPGVYTVTVRGRSGGPKIIKTSVHIEGAAPANAAPTVSAGPDRAITLPATASLDGTVGDDGLPAGSSLTQSWSTVSGPGMVTFGDASAVDTTAAFSAAGTYVLRLTASDGSLSANDTVTVVVTAAPAGNTAPTVSLTEAYATSRVGTGQTLAAVAQDGDGQVATVAFLADGALIGSDASSPWSLAWTPATSGTQRLTATATDDDGASTTSAVVPVLVAGTTDLVDECGTTAPAFRNTIADGAAEDLGGIQVYGDGTKIVPANTTTPAIIDWTVPGVQSLRLRLAATAGEPVTLVVSASADGASYAPVATTAEVVGSANVWTVSDITAAAVPAGTTRIRVSLGVVGAGQFWDAALCRIDFAIGGTNTAPVVSAGPDRAITLPATASLDGTVSDDGLPAGSTLTQTWSTVSGPGTVTFGDASAVDTTAAFSAAGTYVLRLTASDGSLSANDTVTVVVTAAAPSNTAPVANAGPDQTITLPATATLSGSATDDGLPAGASLSYAWTTTSGPGTVTFASSTSAGTTATFSAAGTYVLQLAVGDTALSGTDTITITVNPAAAGNTAPVVDAGPDRAITLPATASLDGTVGDDGLPAGSALTQTWTTISGPGSVTFGNASAVDTTAAFSAAGTYVLRLTASDGTLSASDTVTVVVTAAATPTTPAGNLTLTSGSAGGSCGAGALAALLLAGALLIGLRRRNW